METRFNFSMPKKMSEEFGYRVKGVSDHAHKELIPEEVRDIFYDSYVNILIPVQIPETHYKQIPEGIEATVTIEAAGETATSALPQRTSGCGKQRAEPRDWRRVSAGNVYRACHGRKNKLRAASYVSVIDGEGRRYWGVGIDSDIIVSSVKALLSAVNNMINAQARPLST